MASDCYQLFKSTYNQAIADGLSTAVATAAAQSAMDGCLAKQNSKPATVAQPHTVIKDGRQPDQGPVVPPSRTGKR